MNRTGRIFFVGLTVLTMACGSTAQAQVGTWKDYMAYYDVQDVKKGGSVLYVLASDNLYSYNEGDGSIQTYDKVNGLSDCGIAKIEWNSSVGKLIIVYSDYNIDMLDAKGNITNLSDFYSATISGDKTVNNIYMSGRFAYLSTGFGIVKVNMRDNEISDTYNLKFRVDYCYIDGNYIYAASSTNGLYRAALSDNLLDPGKWSRVGVYTPRSYTVDADLLATARAHRPDGPKANNFYSMKFKYGNLYTVGGRYNQTGDSQLPGTVQVLNPEDGEWIVYEDSIQDKSGHSYIDALCIDVDPTDHSHVMVGARTGLYEFRNGRYVRDWYCQNSDLQQAVGGSVNYTLVTSGAFDGSGNFWFANSQST
ncbi:MAG: Por secretion system protein, partial [Prevotella sp.]|nr:Por secretion system protein [Prevotella sp.]